MCLQLECEVWGKGVIKVSLIYWIWVTMAVSVMETKERGNQPLLESQRAGALCEVAVRAKSHFPCIQACIGLLACDIHAYTCVYYIKENAVVCDIDSFKSVTILRLIPQTWS